MKNNLKSHYGTGNTFCINFDFVKLSYSLITQTATVAVCSNGFLSRFSAGISYSQGEAT